MTQKRTIIELLIASVFWGLSFIAVRFALESFSPLYLTAFRFLGAFGVVLAFHLISAKRLIPHPTHQWKLSVLPGVLLGATIVLQTAGLKFTSVSRSSFLTSLYVVFVPLIQILITRQPISKNLLTAISVALIGMALLCQTSLSGGWNIGDSLTLLCAVIASVHILVIGRSAKIISSPFQFNALTSFFSGIIPLALAFWLEPPPSAITPSAVLGLLFLIGPATLIAFAVQVRAQQTLSESVVSFFYLLEAPIASFFAYLILSESLSLMQILGAGLILVASKLALR